MSCGRGSPPERTGSPRCGKDRRSTCRGDDGTRHPRSTKREWPAKRLRSPRTAAASSCLSHCTVAKASAPRRSAVLAAQRGVLPSRNKSLGSAGSSGGESADDRPLGRASRLRIAGLARLSAGILRARSREMRRSRRSLAPNRAPKGLAIAGALRERPKDGVGAEPVRELPDPGHAILAALFDDVTRAVLARQALA